ncbi:putative ABC multidrug transporter [Xylariomycetidae sp. FL2044]|nr:putative ABC multidrug transporter [Xylariomycetidae sp. FL2044]
MPFYAGEENLLQLNQENFDFNVQFEQLFFSVIPSVIFIATSLWRTAVQARKPTVVNAPAFQLIKLGAITTYVGLELSLLILVAVGSFHVNSMFIASSALKLVSAFFMIILSLVDHSKCARPSLLLNSYLFLTLLLDAAQARTLFLSSADKPELTYSSIFTASVVLKVGILLLEAQRKSRWVSWDEKEHSPEETSGIFSLGVFFWLNKIFLEGYKKVLTIKDLYPLDSSLGGELLHEHFSRKMNYSKLKGDNFGLVKTLARTLKVPLLLPIPTRLALMGFTLCQPFFIERLLDHLSNPEADANIGYGLIGAGVLIYFGIAISNSLTWYFHNRMLTMARSMLVIETFNKATKARIGSGDDGAALTLMSTDIERIRLGFLSLHDIWASIIQAVIAAWMLYEQLGVAFVAPMVTVAVCSLGLGILMRFTGDSQRTWMSGVQKRVGLTATVIANMKSLKLSGLSTSIRDFIQNLRVEELAAGSRFRKIYIIAAVFGYTPMMFGPPLTFAFTQRTLDAARMFTSLSYLLLLTGPLSQIFQAIPNLLSGLACLSRIQAFLESETRHDFRQVLSDIRRCQEKASTSTENLSGSGLDSASPVAIVDGNFGWNPDSLVLRNINTQFPRSSLTIVVGPVGSGKSTLCKAVLGEVPYSEGTVVLGTRSNSVAFCDQTAFLSNGSVRDNIVGFLPFHAERYSQVIEATALGFDLSTLPQGDGTNIGSNGITLSGGQKQRVALARALYLQSDFLVLDDIFSGLDADTEEKVFRLVFGSEGLLRRRRSTVVLCTHSIRHLPEADHIIALEGGTVVEQGSFENLMTRDGYVRRLGLTGSADSITSEDQAVSKQAGRDLVGEMLFEATTNVPSIAHDTDELRQVGDTAVYKHYIKSMGLPLVACSLLSAALWGFFTNFPTVWLKFWTDDTVSDHPSHSYAYYVGIYALLQICAVLSLLSLGIFIFIVAMRKAGANLHEDALKTLIKAPLSFFTSTDTGVVANLFSQDLNLLDTELPTALLNTLFTVSQAIWQAGVMLTSSPYIAISYPFLGALLYVVQKFYLRTSRQLRLLDLETKSPLYTHFIDTTKGIATLRAFGAIPESVRRNAQLLDTSQRPAYLLVMIQQWLILVLDLVVMMMAAVLITLAVQLRSSSGFAGASLVTLMTFGENLSGIVIYYTRLETSMGAIARLMSFNKNVKPEDKDEELIVPPEEWPQHGGVELRDISASYDTDIQVEGESNLALRNIDLTIKPGEKIAVCGRTGSGKSSLVAVLLKLLDPVSGDIKIDNTSILHVDRATLRQRMIAAPQEAVFLPESTFRANLDPFEVSTAEECQDVLKTVGLYQFVQERGGLTSDMNPESLSAGQRQLMSLGRAVLRRRIRARNLGIGGGGSEGGVLLLDEVSSSVDHETERTVQDILKSEFRDYTIVAVSHRLDMIMDFHRVVVMDAGEIVEVGNPAVLADKEGTRFRELVKAGAK